MASAENNDVVAVSISRTFGTGFREGFLGFLEDGQFSDVTIAFEDGSEQKLHSVFLANRSAFFHRALTSDFLEKHERRINLRLDATSSAWPDLLRYFYTDSITVSDENVLPLLALSRQLLVSSVDEFCTEYVRERLGPASCLSYLRHAVRLQLDDLQRECIGLAARGLYHLYDGDVAGLPPQTVIDILQHEDLSVHCEHQVVEFVMKYLSTTLVEPEAARSICSQVRFMYLDNDTLRELYCNAGSTVPRDMLLAASMDRLGCLDKPQGDGSSWPHSLPPPRPSYRCNLKYNLSGGTTCIDVDLESVWDQLTRSMAVRVSGAYEGTGANVLSADSDAWFETNDCVDPPPWIEVSMPPNVTVIALGRITYQHGHRRAGYYRLRNFKVQVAERLGGPMQDVVSRLVDQFEVQLLASTGGASSSSGSRSAADLLQQHALPARSSSAGGAFGAYSSAASAAAAHYHTMSAGASTGAAAASGGCAAAADGGSGAGVCPFQVLRIQATGPQEDGWFDAISCSN